MARLSIFLLTLLCGLGFWRAATAADAEPADTDWAHANETEFSVVPFVGGSSDVGFGGGYIASLAQLRPNHDPYLYRIDTSGSVTFRKARDGAMRVPYADLFLRWKFPHLIRNQLGLELRASYTRETNLGYYGLGNAARLPDGLERGDPFFEHSRVHPTLRAMLEYHPRPFVLSWGFSYTENWLEVPEGTLLANDLGSERAYVSELLGNARPHGVPKFSFGAGWDTRDDEVAPVRGWNITEQLDLVPGTLGEARHRFARWNNAVHVYVPLIAQQRRLVFALRVGSDLLFGNAPLDELPRFDESFALGGSKGVRGIPAQRYYGKIKLLANAELRSELISLRLLGVERRLGLVAFADTGRLWADYTAHPDLDGSSLGLKYGFGGGLRIASGKTFMLRFDLAWSPEGGGPSGYLLAGHMF
ncbi:MAG: BamA/TamA family outer membrane protein [Deltaproteobacteria bacterium]